MAGPTSTAERGARRQESSGPPPARASARRRLRTIIILAIALVVCGGGVTWLLYGSPWLRAERVSVSGTDVLTPRQVREAADVPVGQPMVSLDTDTIAARVRRALPRVDRVDVTRSWPHGIRLEVTERAPVLLLAGTGRKAGTFTEVDDDGVRFATVPRAPKGVPLLALAASPRGSASASLRRFGEDRLMREAVRVAGDVPAAVARVTRTVKVRSFDAVSLELGDGRTVAWGSSEQGAAKARALTALMKASPDARHFDVSVPTAPASAGS
ncbi:cell division protein FtsQ/DivIB [Streptomyces longwoodensis]|uniref:cell division protein FtsQ/DivIB n=1 Tax=Streptomyces longwoodensis TaxID=68231 RepID=UPI0033E0BE86